MNNLIHEEGLYYYSQGWLEPVTEGTVCSACDKKDHVRPFQFMRLVNDVLTEQHRGLAEGEGRWSRRPATEKLW